MHMLPTCGSAQIVQLLLQPVKRIGCKFWRCCFGSQVKQALQGWQAAPFPSIKAVRVLLTKALGLHLPGKPIKQLVCPKHACTHHTKAAAHRRWPLLNGGAWPGVFPTATVSGRGIDEPTGV
eukprot:1161103-Pelagomonas_calceolata.AAC.9